MSFRATRLAYTAASQLPTFHRFCWHIYAMFLPLAVTQPCDNWKRKKMVTRTSFHCPGQQNRHPNQLLSISDNWTGLCPVLNPTLVCSPLNQNGILLTSRNRPTRSWQMPSVWLNLNVRTDFTLAQRCFSRLPWIQWNCICLQAPTLILFEFLYVYFCCTIFFLFQHWIKKKIFKNSCVLPYFIL